MKTKDGVNALAKALKKDKELRYAWQANIAMSFMDEMATYKKAAGKRRLSNADLHFIANEGAERFLKLLCKQIKYPKGR
jgi:hypothetical protein